MWRHSVWLLTFTALVSGRTKLFNEGDDCTSQNGAAGKCQKFQDCPEYSFEITNLIPSGECTSNPDLICCPNSEAKIMTTETSKIQQSEKPPGWKSKEKCNHYVQLRASLNGDIPKKCTSRIASKIMGGESAFPGEFPHMVYWGRGSVSNPERYFCGASLISEQYLLTAAHCLTNEIGPFFARLGTDDLTSQIIVNIEKVIPHPNYKHPQRYNDIALLKLKKPVHLTKYIWPACLQTNDYIGKDKASATGWGTTSPGGIASDKQLLKVTLPLKNISECMEVYRKSKYYPRGVDEKSIICAGGRNLKKDTCQGDSGGPLQIKKEKYDCMYSIVGITSFAKSCGIVPGLYTKVSNYIEWIESIVWPGNE